jgi:hypothetical protein
VIDGKTHIYYRVVSVWCDNLDNYKQKWPYK